MFAGIDIASERHMLARLDDDGAPIGKPMAITEDRAGYDALLEALGPPPVAGRHGSDRALLEEPVRRADRRRARGRAAQPVRRPTLPGQRASNAPRPTRSTPHGLARLAFEKRPAPTRLHDEVAESLRELVRHRDRLRQDFDDRVRQLHRLVDLGFPEFTRYVRSLDSMLATCLLAEYPTAQAFARANPRRLAKLRYDGRHMVGAELADQLVDAGQAAPSASITARSTRCRRATSARISTCGAGA